MTGLMPYFRGTRHQLPWNSTVLLKRKISLDMNSLADYWLATTLPFLTKVIEKVALEQGQTCPDLVRCL